MLYPLYDYYLLSGLCLEEIIEDYKTNFYHRKHGTDKSTKVVKKVADATKIAAIDAFSVQQHVVPSVTDFGAALNETLWFVVQSNETQALAVLIAFKNWKDRVNDVYHFAGNFEIRNKALMIFKKYSIYAEMTKEQYERMTGIQI